MGMFPELAEELLQRWPGWPRVDPSRHLPARDDGVALIFPLGRMTIGAIGDFATGRRSNFADFPVEFSIGRAADPGQWKWIFP
jgi:hypothetical protein